VAWSRLQSKSAAASTSSVAVTMGTALSSGSKLVAFVGFAQPAVASGVSDGTNSFSQILAFASGNQKTYIYVLDTPAGDVGTTPTITATSTGTANGNALLVMELSGLTTGTTAGACLDGTAGTGGGSNQSPGSYTVPAYSSTALNEFLVAVWSDNGDTTGVPLTATPSGFTNDANSISNNGADDLSVVYKNSTNGAEGGGTWTAGGTHNFDLAQYIVAFKIAAAAAASIPPQFISRQQRTVPLHISRGTFSGLVWPQASQGVQFPLFTRQNSRRLIRPPRGKFFVPGQFGLSANPSLPRFTRTAARPPASFRIARGRFFSPGQFNLSADPSLPVFTRTSSRFVPAKPRHGRFFEPGQFNEVAANLPQFIRTAKRPVLPGRRGVIFQLPLTGIAPPVPPQLLSPRRPKLSPPRRGESFRWNIPQFVPPVWPPEFRTTRRVLFTRADKLRRGMIIQLVPFQQPISSVPSLKFRTTTPQAQWATASPGQDWKTADPGSGWNSASPGTQWKTGP